jgi:hypothetical protein
MEFRRPDLDDEPVTQIYSKGMGNWVRKVNHSCRPSAKFREMQISGWWRMMIVDSCGPCIEGRGHVMPPLTLFHKRGSSVKLEPSHHITVDNKYLNSTPPVQPCYATPQYSSAVSTHVRFFNLSPRRYPHLRRPPFSFESSLLVTHTISRKRQGCKTGCRDRGQKIVRKVNVQ